MTVDGINIIDFALNPTWGGDRFPTYSAQASAAAVASPAAEGGAGAGSGTGTAQGEGGGAAPGTGTAVEGGSSAPNPNDANIRTLRENHDRYKGETERWGKLGKYEEVQAAHSFYTKMVTDANTIGTGLGYSAEEIAQCLKEDPERTMAILRQEAKAAERRGGPGPQDITKLIDKRVEELTKPLQEQHNIQLTEKANTAFDAEVNRLIDTTYKGAEAMPAELREPFFNIVSQYFQFDAEGIASLKFGGKTEAVGKAFKQATDFMVKVGQGYVKWENSRRGINGAAAAGQGGGNGKPKYTLDDIIEGNAAAKASGIKSFQ